jgi:ribosomal protein S18 acetylase RimI-like enzyme
MVPLTMFADLVASGISLHPVCACDEPLLYETFASTRTEVMALTGWNADQQEAFLRMQYDAQRRSYLMQIPDAEYWVIHKDEVAAGRLIVHRTAKEIHVVDISLLPQFRNLGIGSALMTAMMKEATPDGKAVCLHVERFNPALRWYQRLGFGVVNRGPIYLEMVWRPGSDTSGVSEQTSKNTAAEWETGSEVAYAGPSD